MIKMREIKKWVEEAWHSLCRDVNKSRWAQWTEAAAITYPFYHHLERLRKKHKIPDDIHIIPEYRFTAPDTAGCNDPEHDNDCKHVNYNIKNNKPYDLVIVRSNKNIKTKETILPREKVPKENRNCTIWCFKPSPLVVFETKYPVYELKDLNTSSCKLIETDLKKLKESLEAIKKQHGEYKVLAYFCILYNYSENKQNTGKSKKRALPELPEAREFKDIQIAEIIIKEDGSCNCNILPYSDWQETVSKKLKEWT